MEGFAEECGEKIPVNFSPWPAWTSEFSWAGWRLRNLIFFSRISKDYPSIRDDHFIRDIHKQRTIHPFDLLVSPFLNLVQTYLENEICEINTLLLFTISPKKKFDCAIWMFEIKCYVTFKIWLNFLQIFFVITPFNFKSF